MESRDGLILIAPDAAIARLVPKFLANRRRDVLIIITLLERNLAAGVGRLGCGVRRAPVGAPSGLECRGHVLLNSRLLRATANVCDQKRDATAHGRKARDRWQRKRPLPLGRRPKRPGVDDGLPGRVGDAPRHEGRQAEHEQDHAGDCHGFHTSDDIPFTTGRMFTMAQQPRRTAAACDRLVSYCSGSLMELSGIDKDVVGPIVALLRSHSSSAGEAGRRAGSAAVSSGTATSGGVSASR